MQTVRVTAIAFLLALGGCASAGTQDHQGHAMKVTKESAEAMIKDAEAAGKAANAAGAVWRDLDKYLKDAKAAMSKGDLDNAAKLAKKAKFQADAGLAQAKSQEKAGPWLF